ncbi:MAG: SPASM domain-containing protein [Acidimicrobiales bacterium]
MRRNGGVPVRVRISELRAEARMDRFRSHHGPSGCFAPRMQLTFMPNGDVRACCRNEGPLGNIAEQRLPDIWAGAVRQGMIRSLEAGEFDGGCRACGDEIAIEGRRGSYPEEFDQWGLRLGGIPGPADLPNRIEFNLSSICNLQCVQCNGDLSSSIRLHREKRAPLGEVYGDAFFDDLAPFLPNLGQAHFAGGEPFLGRENFRVWDMIAATAPDLPCTVCTNATQWNDRVERALDDLRFDVILSLDGISKETFESIRVGADFDTVMANVERFLAYTRARGTRISINHCLMPQNYAEFGDLLLFADERDIDVDVSVVRGLAESSLHLKAPDALRHVVDVMNAQEAHLLPRLTRNRATWIRETNRLRIWATHPS